MLLFHKRNVLGYIIVGIFFFKQHSDVQKSDVILQDQIVYLLWMHKKSIYKGLAGGHCFVFGVRKKILQQVI